MNSTPATYYGGHWGYCLYCGTPLTHQIFPDELALFCLDHAYCQYFRRQPDTWDSLLKTKLWSIIEVGEYGPITILTSYERAAYLLTRMGYEVWKILKPREQWDYFFWHTITCERMKDWLGEYVVGVDPAEPGQDRTVVSIHPVRSTA